MTDKIEALEPWQRDALKEGVEQPENGEFASDEEVAAMFGKWGVDTQDLTA